MRPLLPPLSFVGSPVVRWPVVPQLRQPPGLALAPAPVVAGPGAGVDAGAEAGAPGAGLSRTPPLHGIGRRWSCQLVRESCSWHWNGVGWVARARAILET